MSKYRIVHKGVGAFPYMLQRKFLFWWFDVWVVGERDTISARLRFQEAKPKAKAKPYVVEYLNG